MNTIRSVTLHMSNQLIEAGLKALMQAQEIKLLLKNYPDSEIVIVEDAINYEFLTDTLQKIQPLYTTIPILIVIASIPPSHQLLKRALKCGCRAYLSIHDRLHDKLAFIFQHVLDGGQYFSPIVSPMLEINQQHKVALYESLSEFERTTVDYLAIGLKGVEVAEILNKPVTAIYKAMARARRKFSVSTDYELFETLRCIGVQNITSTIKEGWNDEY